MLVFKCQMMTCHFRGRLAITPNVLRLCEVAVTQNLIINREVPAAILQNRC